MTQQNGTPLKTLPIYLETMPAKAVHTDTQPEHTLRAALDTLRDEVAGGFLYSHGRANANTSRMLEFATFLYSLIEVLEEKGVLSIDELDARKDAVAERVKQRYLTKGMGVHMQESEQDKYNLTSSVEIDCENRVHLCKAACCRLWFPLSKQDVQEGIVQWDLRYPYIIAQDAEGYCKHLDTGSCGCTIYQNRPAPCRGFDCRQDTRIWHDFANKVVNPNLEEVFQNGFPGNQGAEE